MNVKFKMPKFGRNLTGKGWLKELLMTFLGTTISIVLTFGTAQYLADRQTEQARRMMAMTIINDIDQSLEVVKKRKDAEEKGHEATCYVIENQDRLESIGVDTLMMFINYVTYASFDSDMEFKTMNENIFNSSQDTWRTLNDRKFLNNVQEFYNLRVSLEQQSKDLIFFKKPARPYFHHTPICPMGDSLFQTQDGAAFFTVGHMGCRGRFAGDALRHEELQDGNR